MNSNMYIAFGLSVKGLHVEYLYRARCYVSMKGYVLRMHSGLCVVYVCRSMCGVCIKGYVWFMCKGLYVLNVLWAMCSVWCM